MENIDIIRTFNQLFKQLEIQEFKCSQHIQQQTQRLLSKQIWTYTDRQQVLDLLSSLLLEDSCTLLISDYFSPLLLELLSHSVTSDGIDCNRYFSRHELIGMALGKLLGKYPVAQQFCIHYFETNPSLLEHLHTEEEPRSKKGKKDRKFQEERLKKLLTATLHLLVHNCEFFRRTWNLRILIDLIQHDNMDVRWLSCLSVAVLTGMSSANLFSFLNQHFNENEISEFRIKYSNFLQPILEAESCFQMVLDVKQNCSDLGLKTHSQSSLFDSDCCVDVVSVSGVLLKKISKEVQNTKNLVLVPSTNSALRNLVLGVVSGDSILLQGAVGCGKTSLVEYLAEITGRNGPPHLIKIQLGEQMDSKLLLGTHCCTDIPGEFVWHPGPLTQAMMNGYWLLLEDIDYAPMDIISLLVPVLHSKTVTLPGHAKPLTAASGFQLFATQRLISSHGGMQSEFRSHADILSKLWRKVIIESMSRQELEEVIVTKWPALKPIVNRILDIYFMMSFNGHDSDADATVSLKISSGRLISTRDLLKWCHRVSQDFDLTSTETAVTVFQNALDCFCLNISSVDQRVQLAKFIGTKLNLLEAKVMYYCEKYKPDITVSPEKLKIGRVTLPRKQQETVSLQRNKMVFAHTRQATAVLESVAVAIRNSEPVLLVGETGTGKTSIVQYLAYLLGHKLTVINMNQQSDSVDLLGGYKPIELKLLLSPLHEEFEDVFCSSFSQAQNTRFLGHVAKCFSSSRWQDMFKLMIHTQNTAVKKYTSKTTSDKEELSILERWKKLGHKINQLQTKVKQIESTLAFSFIEGSLVKAMRNGEWILLDEINLAEAETLECLASVLESSSGSVLLAERGDRDPVIRHPDFCLFSCMNPASDVGKKDLPPGIRNRFTEFFMDELEDKMDLGILIDTYLKGLSLPSETVKNIVQFYIQIRKDAANIFLDGTGHRPHYSLRTLCRALSFAAKNSCGNVPRSLFEAFCLSFLTQLDRNSHPLVIKQILNYILGKKQHSLLKQSLPQSCNGKYVSFEGYWIPQGSKEIHVAENYILTPSVKQNLKDLARVASAGKYPVLIQGETSVGKTSLIQWLAAASGNVCMRVNNHEHTDLQEYIGSYSADDNGKLFFKEGILVEAVRHGHWIILDELNLAPTEILEALNRILDDNRELYIPETQETIKAHPRFLLFATQNPPGLYGGRKVLSRAFRNRFIELHFDEIPPPELETILHERCAVPPSYCKKLVAIMLELQIRRRQSGIFAGKQGYITLRDLFRWGERYRLADKQTEKFYDWNEHIANEGYMLLAGRVRKQEEADVIQEVIEKHMKCQINPYQLYATGISTKCQMTSVINDLTNYDLPDQFQHIVWTFNMRRLAILVNQAMKFKEPVLLVGDTGCGKTTICQLFASSTKNYLHIVNCHMHSESSDFLGGLRPIRHTQTNEGCQKFFEWVDGPLVIAMKSGDMFLADEISLADDSVLERLNSVLEPECVVLLAEKGTSGDLEETIVIAKEGFQFLATMNPGGDFGKKELSPALRNRFTEIWCPSTMEQNDIINIIMHNIKDWVITGERKHQFCKIIVAFLEWFSRNDFCSRCTVSIRDILGWINFINHSTSKEYSNCELPLGHAYIHGACLVFLDSLGSGMTSCSNIQQVKHAQNSCMIFLNKQMNEFLNSAELQSFNTVSDESGKIITDSHYFGVHPFYIPLGSNEDCSLEGVYTLTSPTTKTNAMRLLRAMQLSKPILLEGVPGVGKTSLVTSLAKASGHTVTRINLSEQTDVSDLFGTDLPIEGKCGMFSWRDGPLLQALKYGYWILLDELNLASQPVLEGLNACLDHRGEIYVPELGRTFQVQHKRTWIFGCQNPHKQGGARKGLPKSFLNRFTQVYIEPLSSEDLIFISLAMFPSIPEALISNMVEFNERLVQETQVQRLWGHKGAPWEFNLRDIFRWCEILIANQSEEDLDPGEYVSLIYADRMRTISDKNKVLEMYEEVFGKPVISLPLQLRVTSNCVQVGYSFLYRQGNFPNCTPLFPLHCQLQPLQSLMKCLEMNWMTLLIGSAAVGKTSIVNLLSTLTGHPLLVLTVSSDMDTTELLGGYEQDDLTRHLDGVSQHLEVISRHAIWSFLLSSRENLNRHKYSAYLFEEWNIYYQLCQQTSPSGLDEEVKVFQRKIDSVKKIMKYLMTSEISTLISNNLMKELTSIEDELKRIEESLNTHGVISSGGKFEWVDSALVTALKKGYWLLLDDVNFCSPSVLDRLNGLLEPNGVLTISEKGVVGEEVPTIKPHPDFRLIMAMDPKNGEISRAMRNRGVEIHLLGEDDGYNPDYLDLCTILQCKGLSNPVMVSNLLNVHKNIIEQSSGVEKPGLLELLQAASMCVQIMQYGSLPKLALWESCHTVYIKNIFNCSTREKIETILTEQLSGFPEDEIRNKEKEKSLSLLLPSVSEFQLDPRLACLKQEGVLSQCLFSAILNNTNRKEIDDDASNNQFCNDIPLVAALPFSVNLLQSNQQMFLIACISKIFMETSSVGDWKLRGVWIHQLVAHFLKHSSSDIIENVINYFMDVISRLLSVFKFPVVQKLISYLEEINLYSGTSENGVDVRDLLLDLRWNYPLFKKLVTSSKQKSNDLPMKIDSCANRFLLLLSYHLYQFMENRILDKMKQRNQYSLLELSKRFNNNQMSVNDLPHSVIQHLLPFFYSLNNVLISLFGYEDFLCHSDDLLNFEEIIKCCHYLSCICHELCTKKSIRNQLSLFNLHWTWMVKKVFPVLFQNDTVTSETSHLHVIITNINKSLETNISSIHKMRSKLVQFLDHLPSLQNEEAATIFLDIQRLSEVIDTKNYIMDHNANSIILYQYGPIWIEELLTATDILYSSSSVETLSKAKEIIQNVQLCMTQKGFIRNKSLTEITSEESKTGDITPQKLATHIQLLPLKDYFCVLCSQEILCSVTYKLQQSLLPEKIISVGSRNCDESTVYKINLVKAMVKDNVLCSVDYLYEFGTSAILNEKSGIAHPLLNFFTHIEEGPSSNSIMKYLTWNPSNINANGEDEQMDLEGDEQKPNFWQKDLWAQQSPVRMFICNMLQNSLDSASLNLGNCFEKIEQLNMINALLWKNISSLSQTAASFRHVNAHIVRMWFNCIAVCLLAVTENSNMENLNSEEEICDLVLQISLPAEIHQILIKAINSIRELNNIEEYSQSGSQCLLVGKAWVYVGLLTSRLLAPRDVVDPVHKWRIKLQYCVTEIEQIIMELKLRKFQSQVITNSDISSNYHPVIKNLLEKKDIIEEKIAKLQKRIIYRPTISQFEDLFHELYQYLSTVGSPAVIFSLLEKLEKLQFPEESNVKSITVINNVIQEVKKWQISQMNFANRLKNKYPLYNDLIVPFLAGLKQMVFGVEMVSHYLSASTFKSHITTRDSLVIETLLTKLIEFPYISISTANKLSPSTFLAKSTTISLIESLLNIASNENVAIVHSNVTKLIKSAMMEIKNEIVISNGKSCLDSFNTMNALLLFLVKAWQQQEEVLKQKKEEQECLYQYRTSHHSGELPEEKQDELEIKEIFPTYNEEFEGLDPNASENLNGHPSSSDIPVSDNVTGFALRQQDMIAIWNIHSIIVTMLSKKDEFPYIAELLKSDNYRDLKQIDYISPFMLRYEVVQYLVQEIGQNLDSLIDRLTINGNLLANLGIQKSFKNSDMQDKKMKHYDIYHNPNPVESLTCRPVLEQLMRKIQNLLQQFPNHPTLKQVLKIIERILNFSIISPLMKFVTGLELVLTVSQDWEVNAHKGVSLIDELSEVTKLIIKWRKLELRCWSECLNSVFNKQYTDCARWWFHLYSLIIPAIDQTGKDNNKTEWKTEMRIKLIETLLTFVECSTLGEFKARLDLLCSFLDHIKHSASSLQQCDMLNILSNVYCFYHQFSTVIDNKIASERKPIEKEIKDFVKIARWNDINFWAVKQGVEKSHHTIHKHMKQFEKILRQPAQSHFGLPQSSVSEEESNTWKFQFVVNDFISSPSLQAYLEEESTQITGNINKQKYQKMRNLCKKICKKSEMPNSINYLNEFSNEIISSVQELQQLDVSKDADAERRKKEVRYIHTRKQKALSDLFKTLASYGLSYKLGTICWNEININNLMLLPYLDINSLLDTEDSSRSVDGSWKNSWNGIHKYFYRSVLKFSSLSTALKSPSKELSPNTIERCKGFIGHLIYLISHQHQQMASYTKYMIEIRSLLNNLQKVADNKQEKTLNILPPQDTLKHWMICVQNLSIQTAVSLKQFLVILECCPLKTEDPVYTLEPIDILPPLISANKDDEVWNEVSTKAKTILQSVEKLIHQFPNSSSSSVWTLKDYETICHAFEILLETSAQIVAIKEYFESDNTTNSLTESLSFIVNEINIAESNFQNSISFLKHDEKNQTESSESPDTRINVKSKQHVISAIKAINHQFLLAVQKIYLFTTNKIENKDEEEKTNKILTENILNATKSVFEQLHSMKIKKLFRKIQKSLKSLGSLEPYSCEDYNAVLTMLPLLDQYVNLMQFFIINQTASQRVLCKLLYILLGTFTELIQKGYCLPPECLEENLQKEGATQLKDIQDGGFGDGEGTKEVSDRLESEDQLDEAHKPGEKKKDDELEQPDIEEEEQGIEMSDDFDGKFHSPEKTENTSDDDGDDDENDEELDKKMGDVEDDDEKLDNELWGSDNESDEEEMKDDDSGQGMVQPDTKIVAKEDVGEKDDDDVKKEDSEMESKPPEMQFDDEEYDGEHINKPEKHEQTPENLELPDDLKLDRDEDDDDGKEDEEEMASKDTLEKMEEEEIDDTEQHDQQADNFEQFGEEDEAENKEPEEKRPEERMECDENEIEPTKEEEKTDEASAPSKDNSTEEEAISADNIKSLSSQDTVQNTNEGSEEWGTGNNNDKEQEQHGEGYPDSTKQTEGHTGETISVTSNISEEQEKDQKVKRNPKPAQEKRTIGSIEEEISQGQVKELSESQIQHSNTIQKSNLYEHVQDSDSANDTQAVDTATERQAKNQKFSGENDNNIIDLEDMDVQPEDTNELKSSDVENVLFSKSFPSTLEKQKNVGGQRENEETSDDVNVTGEKIQTLGVERGPDSSIHTQYELWSSLSNKNIRELRSQVEQNFASWMTSSVNKTAKQEMAEDLWHQYTRLVSPLVQELCEQLRLVLEPTKTSKLKGDYRTGKRLNMRKVIPYIASQFRKDKIWLRRTKPSKREYQIMLAVDDSSSMANNKSKQLAFESLALLGKCLSLLDGCEISVMKFGNDVRLLHPFGESFTDHSGGVVLQEFTFEQKKTRISQLLNYVTSLMLDSRRGPVSKLASRETAQLLIIISDGRGLFNEGEECVRQAVCHARNNNIFLVFLVLDNPENKDSILDIKVPVFKSPDKIEIHSYMAKFPFPFYIILREIGSMPLVLGEALRQWFELVTSVEH